MTVHRETGVVSLPLGSAFADCFDSKYTRFRVLLKALLLMQIHAELANGRAGASSNPACSFDLSRGRVCRVRQSQLLV